MHANDLALGLTKKLSTESVLKHCKELDDENSKTGEKKMNDTNYLMEKPNKSCLQLSSSTSSSISYEQCEEFRNKKYKSTNKKSRRNRKDHDLNFEEDVLRRKLSSISIDSSDGETKTNLIKKENDCINTPANDIVFSSKNEKPSRRNNLTGKSETSNRKDSVSEDIQKAYSDEIETNEAKYEPNRAYTAQLRNAIKLPVDNDSEFSRITTSVRTSETKPTKEATNQLGADAELPAKYSKKMNKKADKKQETERFEEIRSRVIVVKNPRIKSRKKSKSKTTDSKKSSEVQQTPEKELLKSKSKTEGKQRLKEKSKKSSKEKREKSSKTKQEIRQVDGYEVPLQNPTVSHKQDANPNRRTYSEKRKKKTNSSEEERFIVVGKTKYQANQSNYETKSAKTQPTTTSYDGEQKEELEKQKNSQDSSAKYVSKRLSDKDLWHSLKPHVPIAIPNQVRVTRAAKKEDKSKTNDEESKTDKLFKSKKHWDAPRRSALTKDETSKVGRGADSSNWYANAYVVSNAVRPELRGGKPNNKSSYGLSPPKQCARAFSSSGSNSSPYLTESSSTRDSALSSYSYSSSDQSLVDERHNGRQRHLDKHNNNKSNTSSFETNSMNDVTPSSAAFTKARPRQQRSASSTSSFQRYPIKIVGVKSKIQYKLNNESGVYKKHDSKVAGNKNDDVFNDSPPSSPNDNVFEPKFGKRRTKRQNACVVAEGEDGQSPWQHQRLVVVSQKPGALLNRKSGQQKSVHSKQSGNFVKSISGGSDKRPQTIRDLYSLHNVLSDTQNGTVSKLLF